MDYQKHYDALMERARGRGLLSRRTSRKSRGIERHHIVPRSLGGSDLPENLVDLTYREHFVAHQLLVRIFPNSKAMRFALYWMSSQRMIEGSRRYERFKIEFFKMGTQSRFGKDNGMFGKSHSSSALEKMKTARLAESPRLKDRALRQWSDPAIREKMKLGMSKPRRILTCPHCGSQGGGANMGRYHFNKCKDFQ